MSPRRSEERRDMPVDGEVGVEGEDKRWSFDLCMNNAQGKLYFEAVLDEAETTQVDVMIAKE
jgi:hypothetical protein